MNSLDTLLALNDEYQTYIKKVFEKSKEMSNMFEQYYTHEKLLTFKSFDEFLDDINELLPSSTAKILFVKKISDNKQIIW